MPRPTEFEQRQRAREFWAQLAVSGSFEDAQRVSGLGVRQLTRLLDSPEAVSAAVRLTRSCTRLAARDVLKATAA